MTSSTRGTPPRALTPRRRVQRGELRRAATDRDTRMLLALRVFLGVTFLYAGLQKLADRWFFKASAPSSVQSQLRGASNHSPIGGLLGGVAHYALPLGLLIAFAEIAVGMGTLLGLWSKAAATCGLLLSVGFLLTVSWHSRPYYYGADIVFVFAWTPLIVGGVGRLSLDALAEARARTELGLPPASPVTVGFDLIQGVCGFYRGGRCSAQHGRSCNQDRCPVLNRPESLPTAEDLDRRTFLGRVGWAGVVAATAVTAGGVAALIGRLVGPTGTAVRTPAFGSSPTAPTPSASGASPSTSPSVGPPPTSATSTPAKGTPPNGQPTTTTSPTVTGTRIGPASGVSVGGAASFSDPGTGHPAYVLQPVRGRFIAFDATCTHQGCPVQLVGSEFRCPCHGAVFNAGTGAVVQGPARRPLRAIPIQEGADGQLYAE